MAITGVVVVGSGPHRLLQHGRFAWSATGHHLEAAINLLYDHRGDGRVATILVWQTGHTLVLTGEHPANAFTLSAADGRAPRRV